VRLHFGGFQIRQRLGREDYFAAQAPTCLRTSSMATPLPASMSWTASIQRAQQALFLQRRQFRPALRIEPELQSLPFAIRKLGDGVLNFNQRAHGNGKLPLDSTRSCDAPVAEGGGDASSPIGQPLALDGLENAPGAAPSPFGAAASPLRFFARPRRLPGYTGHHANGQNQFPLGRVTSKLQTASSPNPGATEQTHET